MRTKAIIATFIVVILSAALVKFFWPAPSPKATTDTQDKKEEVQADKTSPTIVDGTIAPTVTNLITTTPTVKITATEVTKTPEPKPTEYLRYPNPENSTQEMENRICKVYGKKDCQTIIKWAEADNVRLSPTYFSSARNNLGVLALDCNMITKTMLNMQNLSDEDFLAACRTYMFDAEKNINLLLPLYKERGIDAVATFMRFGTL